MRRPERHGWWAAVLLATVACQPRPAVETPVARPDWPTHDYRAAAHAGQPVYRLDPEISRVDIVVRRGGALARLGHDHAIEAAALEGWAAWPGNPGQARAELRLPVRELDVDPPAARQRHALDTQPDKRAIEGTYRNLQDRVLAASQWPYVLITATDPAPAGADWQVTVALTVRGHQTVRRVPVAIVHEQATLRASGNLALTHAELGLEPFTALAGGLRVDDPIEVYFDLALQREGY